MMLGRYLARGLAGDRNPAEARVWLERAVAQGLAEARNDLDALPAAEPAPPAIAAPVSRVDAGASANADADAR